MRVAVLSGSPKSRKSITLRFVEYVGKRHHDVELETLLVGPRIKRLEGGSGAFDHLIERVASADAVLWATPVYFWLVPAQLKRFIELVFERGATSAFEGKPAAVLTTSIHFYDHTAHEYMRAICDDLGMDYVGGLPASMRDLLSRRGRTTIDGFASQMMDGFRMELPALARRNAPLPASSFTYAAGPADRRLSLGSRRMTIVTDSADPETNLGQMVGRLALSVEGAVDVVDLTELDIRGGCMGCLECGADGVCRYEGRDEFIEAFNSRIASADVVVFAGTVVDRYLSSTWKTFFDRSFFNAHSPRFGGKQMGVLVSGPLSGVPHVREILESWVELQGANLADIVTDECADSAEIDRDLEALAARLVRCAADGYVRPNTFLGVGGKKLFRDEIWGWLRPAFPVDHRYYREHGFYDFPNRKLKIIAMNAILEPMHHIPVVRTVLHGQLRRHLTDAYDKLLESL